MVFALLVSIVPTESHDCQRTPTSSNGSGGWQRGYAEQRELFPDAERPGNTVAGPFFRGIVVVPGQRQAATRSDSVSSFSVSCSVPA